MDVTEHYGILKTRPHEKVVNIPLPGQEDPNAPGLVGILTAPDAILDPQTNHRGILTGHHPETLNLAIMTHGLGGHKNYLYLKTTAHALARDIGWYSFRFDFRDCGDSHITAPDDDEGYAPVRTLDRDREDLDTVARFWNDPANYQHLLDFGEQAKGRPRSPSPSSSPSSSAAKKLFPNALVAHSRGLGPIFMWSLEQWRKHQAGDTSAILIRNLVNLSGRYTGREIGVFMREHWDPRWPAPGLRTLEARVYKNRRYGTPLKIHPREMLLAARVEYEDRWLLAPLNTSGFYAVLNVFGARDNMLEPLDIHKYVNALHRIQRLVLIKGAGHNFHSRDKVTPENSRLVNPLGLPVNAQGHVNNNPLVANHICRWLLESEQRTMFAERHHTARAASRWKHVDGVANFRDIGGYSVKDTMLLPALPAGSAAGSPRYLVRPDRFFRAADVSKITAAGLRQLEDLGIDTVFDLRSDTEILASPFPTASYKGPVRYVHNPMFAQEDLSPQAIFLRYENLLTSPYTIPEVYLDFLRTGTRCVRAIFAHILAHPDGRFVFHCAAGKDRTGVVAMLMLLLAGVDDTTVAKEYELTVTGLAPVLPALKQAFRNQAGTFLAKYAAAQGWLDLPLDKVRAKVNQRLGRGSKDYDIEKQGFESLISAKFDTMLLTINKFNNVYKDGVRGYFRTMLNFSEAEIAAIKNSLVERENPNLGSNARL